jgi:CubicO group peptidase (beta-lactamase class C family)
MLSQDDRDFVDDVVAKEMAVGGQPGFSVLITGPRGDYRTTYGAGKLPGKTPLGINDRFRIGSVTKLFTATAVLIQMDRGLVRLTDTLDEYVSGVPNGNVITVADLLMHQSGVWNFTDSKVLLLQMYLLGGSSRSRYSRDMTLKSIRASKSLFQPGSKWGYSNSNYVLLGLILEAVTGRTVESVITDDVIRPLGLWDTIFPTDSVIPAPFAHGYHRLWFLVKDVTLTDPDYSGAAGAIISTTEDLTMFLRAQRSGALLSPAAHSLRQGLFNTGIPYYGNVLMTMDYGLGMMRLGSWFGHNGAIIGYGAIALYEANSGATFVALQNSTPIVEHKADRIFFPIAERLYPGTL